MKSFLILYHQTQSQLMNDDLLTAHVVFLKRLHANKQLILCGPITNEEGAMLVIQAESHEKIERLIKEDPLIKYQYYRDYEIKEFIEANPENNWLGTESV